MKIWFGLFHKSQQVEFEQDNIWRSIQWVSEWTHQAASTPQPPGHAHLLSVASVERRTLVQAPWRGREEREELGLRVVTDSLSGPVCPPSDTVEPEDKKKRQKNKTAMKNNNDND